MGFNVIEPISCEEAFKAIITLNNLLSFWNSTMPELLSKHYKKVRDDIQVESNFTNKQINTRTYFAKAS